MNADHLLSLYDHVSEAPDAVDRLRCFVLDLAMRGKLVKQEPGDKPASELLKQIEAEKTRLKIKNRLNPLTFEEIPFALPVGWGWSRIGELCTKTGSGSTPRGGKSVYRDSGIPFLRSQNVFDWGLRLDSVAYIGPDVHARMAGTTVRPGDLLLNITGGSMGRCARVPGEFSRGNVSQHVAIVRPAIPEMADFLHKLILSPYFQRSIFGEQTGAGRGGLPKNRMDQIPVAVPPLAEQRRIVTRVDELMSLCHQLEANRKARESTRDRLTKACYARLSAPDMSNGALRSHAHFAVDALPALTVRVDQIKQLRQAILDLAVSGKLAEQDPLDQSASELLKRITAKKARLTKSKQIKRLDLDPIGSGEEPFQIPTSWCWTRLGNIGDWGAGSTPSRANPDLFGGNITWLKSGELNDNLQLRRSEETITNLALTRGSFRMNQSGDVLVAMYGATIGKLAILAKAAVTNQAVCGCTPFEGVFNRFLFIFLLSERKKFQASSEGGAQPNISKVKIVCTPFPLPPLAEQHRIVAKVDKLMGLCDHLEAGLNEVNTNRSDLLESVLHEAL